MSTSPFRSVSVILSARVVVVRKEYSRWKYLFLRAYRNCDFPKGIVEFSEDPMEAARRKVQEEAGITGLHFRWGSVYKEKKPYYSKDKTLPDTILRKPGNPA